MNTVIDKKNDTIDNDTIDNDTIDNDTIDNDTIDNDTIDNDKIEDAYNNIHSNIGNNASLSFFTNPIYLSKINKKYKQNDEKNINNLDNIKFYKKRIIGLFKDIIKGNEPTNCSNEIKDIHNLFVSKSIIFFEMIDMQDILQDNNKNNSDDLSQIENNNLIDIDPGLINNVDNIMMRKTVNVSNLDNYVINNTDNDISGNPSRIIPLKINIDLKSPHLKTKGIKKKNKPTI